MHLILLLLYYIKPMSIDFNVNSVKPNKKVTLSVIIFDFITLGIETEIEGFFAEKFDPNNSTSYLMKLLTLTGRQKNLLNLQNYNKFLTLMKKIIAENYQAAYMIQVILEFYISTEISKENWAKKTFNSYLKNIIYKIDEKNITESFFVDKFYSLLNYDCLSLYNINFTIPFNDSFENIFDEKITVYCEKSEESVRYILNVYFEYFLHNFITKRFKEIDEVVIKILFKTNLSDDFFKEYSDIVVGYLDIDFKDFIEPIISDFFKKNTIIKEISFFVKPNIKRYILMLEFIFFDLFAGKKTTKDIILACVENFLTIIHKNLVVILRSYQFFEIEIEPRKIEIYTIV